MLRLFISTGGNASEAPLMTANMGIAGIGRLGGSKGKVLVAFGLIG